MHAAVLAGKRISIGDPLALVEDHAGQRCAAAALDTSSHSRLCCLQEWRKMDFRYEQNYSLAYSIDTLKVSKQASLKATTCVRLQAH